eukprot:GILJ01005109.1.p1 GENE.GILJ01005109.1~~GILJ01005109.1.p1  ORF type:complete len:277 (-),score=25.67 GILJ01005109.1:64-840(-)
MTDRKSNTTSSIYVSSTISAPNVQNLIRAVSTILHDQIQEDETVGTRVQTHEDLFVFSEEKYIRQKPDAFSSTALERLRQQPSVDDISNFIKALYECAEFSTECCVLSLIFINRLIAFTGLPLHATNWRPLVFCALLVAQKVWDDRYLGNADFAYIYPFFNLVEVNDLERKFLRLLQYHVTVKPSMYAKYYFELRSLNPMDLPLKPLDAHTAEQLEARSSHFTNILQEDEERGAKTMFLSKGTDGVVTGKPKSFAVLS